MHTQVVVYDDWDDLSLLLPADCLPCFGSSGVSALDTTKPVTAPMTVTGKRSVCPPKSPSRRAMVNGRGNTALAAPAIPASTPTPCGINVRISDSASPSVPPMNSTRKDRTSFKT